MNFDKIDPKKLKATILMTPRKFVQDAVFTNGLVSLLQLGLGLNLIFNSTGGFATYAFAGLMLVFSFFRLRNAFALHALMAIHDEEIRAFAEVVKGDPALMTKMESVANALKRSKTASNLSVVPSDDENQG